MTTTVGTITHAKVVTGEPVAVDGTQKILRRLVLTDVDGRQWEKNLWFAVCDGPEQCSTSREKASVLEPLFTATPTQLEEFEQDDAEIRWPALGVVCSKTERFWFFHFDLIETEQEVEERENFFNLHVRRFGLLEKRDQIEAVLNNPGDPNHINNLAIYRRDQQETLEKIRLLNIAIAADWPVTDQTGGTDTASTGSTQEGEASLKPDESTGMIATLPCASPITDPFEPHKDDEQPTGHQTKRPEKEKNAYRNGQKSNFVR
ncbi:MAG: hypothetical protein HQL90_08165 [Magnetococcales bacterium]|nr:hypothetical protein [Magnetococcales bacterium]